MISQRRIKSIGVIGGGNMGAAIISGVCKKYKVRVYEQDRRRRQYLQRQFKVQTQDLSVLFAENEVIILAIKPQGFELLLEEVQQYLAPQHLIISIAAGISTSYIEKKLGQNISVVRTMPNLPAEIAEGMTAVCKGRRASKADISGVCRIFDLVGKTVVLEEKWMDAVTAVSGSGPAYVFFFVECFIKAAKALGLKEGIAKELVMETLRGSLNLLESRDEEAAVLRKQVTSKGGTTQAALEVFSQNSFEKIYKNALRAAEKRAQELSK